MKDFHILVSKNGEELLDSSFFFIYNLFLPPAKGGIMATVGHFVWSSYTQMVKKFISSF